MGSAAVEEAVVRVREKARRRGIEGGGIGGIVVVLNERGSNAMGWR